MRADSRTKSRVGVIVFASLLLFAVAIVVVGGKRGFFLARTSYLARFPNSLGLIAGNQVRLAGVTVGAVRGVDVPGQPGSDLTVHFDIERRYQHLVRTDSRVEIRTIGLLGDRYLEVSTGSPALPALPPDSEIKAFRGAELDKLLSSSGDLVDNVVAITKSLKTILARTEKGEGLLGEVTTDGPNGRALSRSLRQALESANQLLTDVGQGRGLIGRLVHDEKLAQGIGDELQASATSLHRVLAAIEKGADEGDGLLPALIGDPEGKKKVFAMVDSLKATADGLKSFTSDLSGGNGLVPQLLRDEAFAKAFLEDLKQLSGHLANVSKKLDSSDGTVGKLIADPAVADAINDILVGVNESKMLRWLVRDRQKSGITVRYDAAQAPQPATTPGPTP